MRSVSQRRASLRSSPAFGAILGWMVTGVAGCSSDTPGAADSTSSGAQLSGMSNQGATADSGSTHGTATGSTAGASSIGGSVTTSTSGDGTATGVGGAAAQTGGTGSTTVGSLNTSAGGAGVAEATLATGTSSAGGGGGAADRGWQLVWSDEFEAAGIDMTQWEHEVNCWGGGNNEQQCYVDAAKNSFIADGMLHLVVLSDNPSGAIQPGIDDTVVSLPYSSARLRTLGQGDWKYGRFEVRARLPFGQGLWPAIWMLPTDNVYGGWAASGEIDIMEAVNISPSANQIHGTLHYGAAWPENIYSGNEYTPPGYIAETFFTYAVEWEEGEIRWYVDQVHYATQTEWSTDAAAFPAPFDQRFHLILNVAVGGDWPGPPNAETTFPQEMLVDYVRVYECSVDPSTGKGCSG